MFCIFAALAIADVGNLLAWDEAEQSTLGECLQNVVGLGLREPCLLGYDTLVNEAVVGKESTVVTQQCNDDALLVGGYLTEAVEVFATDEEAYASLVVGLFVVGDIACTVQDLQGCMDADGYITITGRMKSVIVLDNGKNVFPEEIEEYLEGIDLIAESVVVGREEEDGTHLVAVIFPNYAKYTALQENEFRTEIQKRITQLNKRLPSFKQIHKLEFRKTEFEKTTTKKIKRHLVK